MLKTQLILNESSDIMLLPHPYTHIEQIKYNDLETLQAVFNEGRCHIYATVLQTFHNEYQLQAIYRDDEIQHVYLIHPETEHIMDSTGTYDSMNEYMNADGINRFLMVEHKPITIDTINTYIDKGTLIPSSLSSIEIAEKTMHLLKQI